MGLVIKNPLGYEPQQFSTRRATKYLVVHCADTTPGMDIGAVEIDGWHRNERGWKAIGYHYVIRRDGTIERGRTMYAVGAHVNGHNSHSVGICLVGGRAVRGGPEDNFTLNQLASLRALLTTLRTTYGNPVVLGHRDLSPDVDGDGEVEQHEWLKSCPSFDVIEWAEKVGLR